MSRAMKTEKPPNPTRTLAYVGVRPTAADKLCHAYVVVDAKHWKSSPAPDAELRSVSLYLKPLGHWTRPGQVIVVEYDAANEGSAYPATAKVVGSYPEAVCAEWAMLSETYAAADRAAKAAKKEGKRDVTLELLEPLRKAFRKLRTREQRSIFLARVTDYITHGDLLR